MPVNREPEFRPVVVADSWLPPGGYEKCSQWALENTVALEVYAQHIAQYGTAAEQLQQYLASHPDALQG